MAQDVKPILPELVEQSMDKDQTLSMNYLGLLPVVIKAIQEQQATITSLRSEVAALQVSKTNSVNKAAIFTQFESSDTTNVSNGNVTTDANGEATANLSDDFESLHRDFRYQLTVIGQFAQAIVSSEIKNNSFKIKTDKPNVRVSWQVTGIRKDEYLNVQPAKVSAEQTLEPRRPELPRESLAIPAPRSCSTASRFVRVEHPTNTQQMRQRGPPSSRRRSWKLATRTGRR